MLLNETKMRTIMKEILAMNLEKVTKLVNDQLPPFIQQITIVDHGFQSWSMIGNSYKQMRADEISANVIVALDGLGDFTSNRSTPREGGGGGQNLNKNSNQHLFSTKENA